MSSTGRPEELLSLDEAIRQGDEMIRQAAAEQPEELLSLDEAIRQGDEMIRQAAAERRDVRSQ